MTLTDLLGDTCKVDVVVNHEEVDSCLGTDGAVDVHGVELEWNVATFNVQLDVMSVEN